MRSGTGDIRTAALLLAVATGACAGHLPPCPAAGGPAWTELQSTHFRLRTDGDAAAGRAALDDLEQFQAALLTVFGAPANHDTTPAAAWTSAFGAQTPANLGVEVMRYVDGGQYALLRYRFTAPQHARPAERQLSDAATHATRAMLYLTGPNLHGRTPDLAPGVDNPRSEAKAEVGAALREEPDYVAARAIAHFMLGTPLDLGQATLLSRKHADDWLAWLLVATASSGRDGAADQNVALEQALDLAVRDPSVHIPISGEEK